MYLSVVRLNGQLHHSESDFFSIKSLTTCTMMVKMMFEQHKSVIGSHDQMMLASGTVCGAVERISTCPSKTKTLRGSYCPLNVK